MRIAIDFVILQEILKMAQRNEVTLVCRIGQVVKFAKSSSGNEYAYFMVEVENQTNAAIVGDRDNEMHQTLHVMCFRRQVIKYLKDIEAKTGNIIVVFGYIGSYLSEIKGKTVLQNTINATEIYVVKTK